VVNKPESSLVMSLGKALNGMLLLLIVIQVVSSYRCQFDSKTE